jgi:hypothetical protein
MTNEPAPGPARDVSARDVSAREDPASRPSAGLAAATLGSVWLAARSPAPGELAAAETAALCWLDPDFEPEPGDPGFEDEDLGSDAEPPCGEESCWLVLDSGNGRPERWEFMSGGRWRELLGDDRYSDGFYAEDPSEEGEDAFADLVEAGFTHRYPEPGATGFRAGGPLDVMLPGSELAWHLGAARQRGLAELSDDELIGFLVAARRGEAWQAAMVLAATAELDARRAGPDGREGEHVADELAAALTLTARSAQAQLELCRQLERLPHTAGLLANGIIDRSRAVVITSHLALLGDADAAEVDAVVAARAGGMTSGQLSARCHRAVVAHDPLAYLRRKKQAEKNARVECWTEHTGTAAIAGRDLDRAAVIVADKSLDEAARWLQQQGVEGTLDQLRAAVFLARVSTQPLHTFLPSPPAAADAAGGADGADAAGGADGADAAGGAAGAPGPGNAADPGTWPAAFGGPGTAHPAGPVPAGPSWINLTVPAATVLDLADRPGEISGTGASGPADAETCRQLADALARNPAARWCITVVDRAGRAVAHGCARAGPGPPGSDRRAWLATIKITPIETATCAHRYQTAAYHPSPTLRHRVKIRSPRCGFPGCRRAAARCDDDHTIPWLKGGRTCECNLYPLCQHHHRCKQAEGWHLAQPQPGLLVWTAPSGRTYTVTPEPYPA